MFTRVLRVLTSFQLIQLTDGGNIDALIIYFCLDKWPAQTENGCVRCGCRSSLNGTYLSI